MESAESGMSAEEIGRQFLQEMSDADFTAFMLYARDMVQAVFDKPRIVVGVGETRDPLLDELAYLEDSDLSDEEKEPRKLQLEAELEKLKDQMDPDDLDASDFWFAFTWGQRGGPDIPVRMGESETTVEAVETFRDNGSLQESSEGSENVPHPAQPIPETQTGAIL
jgi:hypothetical protein